MLLAVAALCLCVQVSSATLQERSLETPNAATWLANSLVSDGQFAFGGLRALQLPGESLYLAAGFMTVPEALWPYLHVPVVVLFVTSIAAIGFAVGGSALALAAGALASLDPYIVRHGPVWDDTLMAAALEWCLLAILITLAARPADVGKVAWGLLPLVACMAALAALTRSLSQLVLTAVAILAVSQPRLRRARTTGVAVLIGVAVALGTWGTRNYVVLGSFHLGSSHDGEVLFKSNCRYTREGIREQGVVGTFMHDCSAVQAALALTLGELEYDRQLREYALAYMASNPVDVAKTAAFKLGVSLSGFNFAVPALSLRNVVAVTSSLFTFSLGLYGLWLVFRRIPPSPLLSLLVSVCLIVGGLTVLMLAVGPTGLRYRIGFNGFLYLGVAAVLTERLPLVRSHPLFFPGRIISVVRN